ncbi:MAG: hypothetical protein Q8P41_26965 [Pseudomonadota bacterium]|nr:hypothetical protein [Pseudomonadota bacterium]
MITKPEKFRLTIVGADEDVPRLLLTYGRGCGGEVAFAMRPRDNVALHVHQVKKAPAKVWRTDLGLAPSHAPELDLPPADAVAEIKRVKAGLPPAGPATLRGKWSGYLFCDDGTPSVRLERKVAAYGTLKLASGRDGRWTATFDRAGKWFTQAKQESAERTSLAEAIQAGMGLVIGLVSEACSFRDTRRRNAVDADYAVQHPYTPPKGSKDPTERYQGRSSFRAVEQADGWVVVNDVGSVVAKFGTREKGKAEKHANALTRGKAPAATASAEIASGFGLGGMPGLTVAPALSDIPTPEPPACPTSVANIASATEKEAAALEELSRSLWGSTEAPELLGRAGKLLRRAEALVKSPLCSGKEQKAAWEDLRRGADAYAQARDAILRGEKPDIVVTLRRIAERVSLAAARAAKSCAAGQQKIVVPPSSPPPMQPVWPTAAAPQTPAAPAKPPRTRKAKAPEVDPEKDKLLVNAFADAIKQAAAQMGGGA